MKKLLLSLFLAFLALVVIAGEAEARRLGGGGRPIGRQSQNLREAPSAPSQSQSFSPSRPADTASRYAPQQPAAIPRPSSPMGGMMGGALLGFGAGSLLSHLGGSGMGSGMGQTGGGGLGTILLFALIVGAVIFLIRRSRRNS
jgi:predicted lipid-binding transport protein (Tim44 family)